MPLSFLLLESQVVQQEFIVSLAGILVSKKKSHLLCTYKPRFGNSSQEGEKLPRQVIWEGCVKLISHLAALGQPLGSLGATPGQIKSQQE